jgi:hypothetical protein
VHGATWQYDGSATGTKKISYGTCFVVVGIIIHLPFLARPVCLPVLARLHVKDGPGKVAIAAALISLLAAAFPERRLDVVADAAYHGKPLAALPATVTWTCRIPRNAALYDLPPAATGKRGRPRTKGGRLGQVADLAATRSWKIHTLRLYDNQRTVRISELTCLWHGSFGSRPVRVIWIRHLESGKVFDLALVTTDLVTPAEQLVIRYSWRWSIEQAFLESRHLLGVGQARSRTRDAVMRTLPLGLVAYSLVIVWYAQHGHNEQVVADQRRRAPWYTSKTQPSFDDMLAQLRRTIIASRFSATRPDQPDPTSRKSPETSWPGLTQSHNGQTRVVREGIGKDQGCLHAAPLKPRPSHTQHPPRHHPQPRRTQPPVTKESDKSPLRRSPGRVPYSHQAQTSHSRWPPMPTSMGVLPSAR